VFVGMRNWHPFLRDTIADMAGRGHRHVLAIILSPLRCEASWDRYQRDVAEACAGVPKPPAIRFAPAWSSHPSFIAAVTDRTRVALAGSAEAAPLVFTAHSIPTAMAAASPYVEELTAAAQAVAGQLGARAHEIAYQSRSGSPQEPWLEPDVNDTLRRLAAAGASEAVAVPIGFVCDHVEVLYDLDVEARATAAALGLTLRRASAVNDHPEFVAMLADLVTGGAA
jgi:ferrochelatase